MNLRTNFWRDVMCTAERRVRGWQEAGPGARRTGIWRES